MLDLVSPSIKCPICKGSKDPQEFLSASGERTVKTCRECRARVGGWKKAHPEAARVDYERHQGVYKERAAAWYHANLERARSNAKKWREESLTPEMAKSYQQTWLAKPGNKEKRAAWVAILEFFNHTCAYCLRADVLMTMDHVVPISKGGEHTAENIVPACRPCNSEKNNRPMFIMLGK
jgi:5-methylcytosine-specific restriction endonuclease McrA